MSYTHYLVAAASAVALASAAHAAPPTAKVEVTNPPGEALAVANAPGRAIIVQSIARKMPVRCSGFARRGERDSTAARLTCRIPGESGSFTEVAAGKYIALTDVTIAATNAASVDLRYNIRIGAGTTFGPGSTGARFIGTTDPSSRDHFTTPFVIATEGRSILVSNFGREDEPAFAGIDVSVEVFGYIADAETLGY